MSMSSHSSISHLASARHFACSIFNRSQWSGIRSGQWEVGSGQRERERESSSAVTSSVQLGSRFSVQSPIPSTSFKLLLCANRKGICRELNVARISATLGCHSTRQSRNLNLIRCANCPRSSSSSRRRTQVSNVGKIQARAERTGNTLPRLGIPSPETLLL